MPNASCTIALQSNRDVAACGRVSRIRREQLGSCFRRRRSFKIAVDPGRASKHTFKKSFFFQMWCSARSVYALLAGRFVEKTMRQAEAIARDGRAMVAVHVEILEDVSNDDMLLLQSYCASRWRQTCHFIEFPARSDNRYFDSN